MFVQNEETTHFFKNFQEVEPLVILRPFFHLFPLSNIGEPAGLPLQMRLSANSASELPVDQEQGLTFFPWQMVKIHAKTTTV